jgi:hypothetical protein
MKSAFSLFLVVTIAIYANISEATDKQSDIVPSVNQLVSLLLDGPSEPFGLSGFEQLKVCEFPATPEACEVLVLVTLEGHSWGNSFRQYLALFHRNWIRKEDIEDIKVQLQPYSLVAVTQIGYRGTSWYSLAGSVQKNGAIELYGKTYGRTDSQNKPTVPTSLTVKIIKVGGIVQLWVQGEPNTAVQGAGAAR